MSDNDEADVKAERLEKLATFQYQMILHAFKCESNVKPRYDAKPQPVSSAKRVVYSTCSIHPEEDEQVVIKALNSPTAKQNNWTLAPRSEVLPAWERRGRPEEMGGDRGVYCSMGPLTIDLADGVIRCMPGEDKTNGFFVACFIKQDPTTVKRSIKQKRGREDESLDTDVQRQDDAGDDEKTSNEVVEQSVSTKKEIGQTTKQKTAAQLARKRRKKQAQQARRAGE